MNNLPFAIWMVGYVFACKNNVESMKYYDETISSGTRGIAALLKLFIWIYVGQLLYVG